MTSDYNSVKAMLLMCLLCQHQQHLTVIHWKCSTFVAHQCKAWKLHCSLKDLDPLHIYTNDHDRLQDSLAAKQLLSSESAWWMQVNKWQTIKLRRTWAPPLYTVFTAVSSIVTHNTITTHILTSISDVAEWTRTAVAFIQLHTRCIVETWIRLTWNATIVHICQ